MPDATITVECAKCRGLNFMPIVGSTGQFACVSCGADLRAAKPRTDDKPAPARELDAPGEIR
jgi:hypothetical protein